jgi:hypothetical protein
MCVFFHGLPHFAKLSTWMGESINPTSKPHMVSLKVEGRRTYMRVHTHTYTYIHACMRTYTHAYIHTCGPLQTLNLHVRLHPLHCHSFRPLGHRSQCMFSCRSHRFLSRSHFLLHSVLLPFFFILLQGVIYNKPQQMSFL